MCRKIPTGRYKKAHRHAAGTHVHAVSGEGYSLLWYEGDSEFNEIRGSTASCTCRRSGCFISISTPASEQARYLAGSLGSRRYPFISLRRKSSEGGGPVGRCRTSMR